VLWDLAVRQQGPHLATLGLFRQVRMHRIECLLVGLAYTAEGLTRYVAVFHLFDDHDVI